MRANWMKALSAAAIVTVSVLFALVAVEMYARYAKPTAYQNDKELGWKLLPNVNITFDNLRFDQTEYKALITTNELGLRESGRKDNPQLTILVSSGQPSRFEFVVRSAVVESRYTFHALSACS
jgi:hypothetical protein